MTNIRKIHCNYCGVDTNHELKASHSKHDYEEEDINGQSYLRYYEESEFNFGYVEVVILLVLKILILAQV
ncbi:hypothetical protein D1115_08570 [Vibrio alfacsensis]|uniref:Uncharacterized protein n=1 Tax=Vibrio alfacsensis TaxID=1074311 RepID=A0ABN5PD48_9VIBR|nr:hypothetical protein D1115_08570 [Vibrio alfacsensis]